MDKVRYVMLVIILTLIAGCTLHYTEYTTEAKFAPNFEGWNATDTEFYYIDMVLHIRLRLQNPDLDSPIKEVIGIYTMNPDWTLISYGYVDGDIGYIYISENEHYTLWKELPAYKGDLI